MYVCIVVVNPKHRKHDDSPVSQSRAPRHAICISIYLSLYASIHPSRSAPMPMPWAMTGVVFRGLRVNPSPVFRTRHSKRHTTRETSYATHPAFHYTSTDIYIYIYVYIHIYINMTLVMLT